MNDQIEKIKEWVREWAGLSALRILKEAKIAPGQPLCTYWLLAPEIGFHEEGYENVYGTFAVHAQVFGLNGDDPAKVRDYAKTCWMAMMISMWDLATKEMRERNLKKLEEACAREKQPEANPFYGR